MTLKKSDTVVGYPAPQRDAAISQRELIGIRIKATSKIRIDISFHKNGARLVQACPIEHLPIGKPAWKASEAGFYSAPRGDETLSRFDSKRHLESFVHGAGGTKN